VEALVDLPEAEDQAAEVAESIRPWNA
jgi:hypothetical protein